MEQTENNLNKLFFNLFQNMNITFFSYNKFFSDGTNLRLSNNNFWSGLYFKEGYYNDIDFYKYHFEKVPNNSQKAFLWIAQPPIKMYDALARCNIGNGLSIYRKWSNQTEVFCFASTAKNTEINKSYFDKIDNFNIFVNIFKKNALEFMNELVHKKLIKSKVNPCLYPCSNDSKCDTFFNSLLNGSHKQQR